jgi:hypothetical protein
MMNCFVAAAGLSEQLILPSSFVRNVKSKKGKNLYDSEDWPDESCPC